MKRITSLFLLLLLRSASPAAPPVPGDSGPAALSLTEAVRRAVADNPVVSEARLGIAVAQTGVARAAGSHYPRLTLEGSANIRQEPFPYIPAQSPQQPAHFSDRYAYLGPVLTIPLYQGGQIRNGVRLAELRQRLQEDSFVITRDELIANVVTTYHKILQLTALVEASDRAVAALAQQQANAQRLLDLGRTARVDLLKVEVQRANEEQRLSAVGEALRRASAALRVMMGQAVGPDPPPLLLVDSLAVPAVEADFEAGLALAKSRPKFLVLQKAVEDADLSLSLAVGRMLPAVNAVSGYQQQFGFNPRYDDGVWYAGATLSLPLFDRGSWTDVTRERLQKMRSEEKLKAAEHQLRLDLRVAQGAIAESRKRVVTAGQAVALARESFRIEQENLIRGAGTMSDLLLAQAALANAEANRAQALFDYNIALLDWRRASGDVEVYLR